MTESHSFMFDEVTCKRPRNDSYPVPTVSWEPNHGIYDVDAGMNSIQQNDHRFLQVRVEEYKRVSAILHVECMKQSKLILRLHTAYRQEMKKRKHLEFILSKAEPANYDKITEMGNELHRKDCEYRRKYGDGAMDDTYMHDRDIRHVSKGYAKESSRENAPEWDRDAVNGPKKKIRSV